MDERYNLWVTTILPLASTLVGSEQIALVQAGVTVQADLSTLASFFGSGGSQTLAQTLLIGNKTGGTNIISDNTFSYAGIDDTISIIGYSDGTVNNYLSATVFQTAVVYSDLTNSGSLLIDTNFTTLSHSAQTYFNSPIYTFLSCIANTFAFIDSNNNLSTMPVQDGIVALVGGGQTYATILSSVYNSVDTVATAGDSVKCDNAISSQIKEIYNTSTNDMTLYPAIGEKFINGATDLGIDTPITIGAGNSIKLICYITGIWRFT